MTVSKHDANLVDILFDSAMDGEYVRDQIFGTMKGYELNPAPTEKSISRDSRKSDYVADPVLIAELKDLEREAIRTAESNQLDKAAAQLTRVIDDYPFYASAYNNRAQVYRLQGKQDLALADLDLAIEHASEDEALIGQAYTQKAIILRARGDQDGAFYNFSMGAKYGNEVAKMAAPKENPYAKMCGKIVSEAMRQLVVPAGSGCRR
ncbi:hypothetical protein GGI07_005960 [Coemansia sp. Benny D115]|nr:hypothetical protein GGI07_005960 [Coemansia sp. Benny D115]